MSPLPGLTRGCAAHNVPFLEQIRSLLIDLTFGRIKPRLRAPAKRHHHAARPPQPPLTKGGSQMTFLATASVAHYSGRSASERAPQIKERRLGPGCRGRAP